MKNKNEKICECGHKQWSEHKCTFEPMVAQECNVKGCKCKKFKLKENENKSLSEKIKKVGRAGKAIEFEDVKEFIEKRNILDWQLHTNQITWYDYVKKREKLVGKSKMSNKKLKNGKQK